MPTNSHLVDVIAVLKLEGYQSAILRSKLLERERERGYGVGIFRRVLTREAPLEKFRVRRVLVHLGRSALSFGSANDNTVHPNSVNIAGIGILYFNR